ncbi:hypothetical protein [Streptomyces sp. NPDC006739]|uniref:hypothetical protein n=1 Tax=Streptomyces sp. NPDC006739 TaxID=3364763 RepID=UPI00369C57DA
MAGAFLHISGVDELIAAMSAMRERVSAATPLAVVAAQAVIEGRARAELSRYSHPRGTPTPAPPGGPPARIDGRLRDSFDLAGPTAAGAGVWRAVMGPTAVYARIQELGGTAGRGHHTTLPARPYLHPAAQSAIDSGLVRDQFVRLWGSAIAR